ncbi:ImmA/IrrE family metallo-endopeptidase [Staphylococcus nepalensis]|uniref:ImmA/IrrE family metallo-endopeptidase n=1 Tax=Staphylococcus nepalensis TaxID=214473 RepID=UPI000DFC0A73|nr:ImmA/IrrE family metallo-endopeptidase [Staphylococcus nepalensis]SUM66722.1 phage protein [Staphylococcus nepalensis]SUM94659.1 phage protein [Staphylococcus nepalensis]
MNYEENEAFTHAIETANQTLGHDATYPVPIKDIINNDPDVELFTFGEFAKLAGVKRSEVFKIGQSYEAFHFKKGKKAIIVYNALRYSKRLRFTLAHEYGHVKLNHTGNSIYDPDTSNVEYTREEFEADTFAGNLLFPLHKRYEFRRKSSYEIANTFNISFKAIRVSMCQLEYCLASGIDQYLTEPQLRTLDGYINFLRACDF